MDTATTTCSFGLVLDDDGASSRTWGRSAGSVSAHRIDLELAESPTATPAAAIIDVLTLSASRPPPAGITFEAKAAVPIVPRTRTCFSPPNPKRNRFVIRRPRVR